jgi:hypothetical protein
MVRGDDYRIDQGQYRIGGQPLRMTNHRHDRAADTADVAWATRATAVTMAG